MVMEDEAPAGFVPFYDSTGGVRWLWRTNSDGTYDIAAQQNVDDILDNNKRLANDGDGYTPSREMRRVASVPWILWHKWLVEEGWDCMNPQHSDRLMRKLNDIDYRFLRTAPGHLGPTQDGGFR